MRPDFNRKFPSVPPAVADTRFVTFVSVIAERSAAMM
jgi:hypothetical protein